MIDGNYNVILKTPMGAKKGELHLEATNDVLTGNITVGGKGTALENGTVSGDNFSFSGSLKSALGNITYDCSGTVEENALVATVKTKKGNFQLKGNRK
ncbi:Uncharacterised protein [Streptococcus gallolyticus]|uniref:Uncharacterized protein n=1 Tax=Streptococcus gallolyticus TaxID=315405 RepID=A0AA94M120_9STRE|nr:hypothetical protein [Streptococcus gallolyticus]AQP41316.1 hypothetical protein BTR42_01585 [Streptococcus gallolyticus subsp. gallolyticus DSM 16831]SQG78598.1 Uncharacterised protein [Streptococcus gallolyticus]